MMKKKLLNPLVFTVLILSMAWMGYSCSRKKTVQAEYCTPDDYKKMTKIDAHCHISAERTAFMEIASEDNFKILSINTDVAEEPPVEEQQRYALLQKAAFPGRLAYLTTFTMKGWDDPDWQKKTMTYLEESFIKGAVGIKVWKNIGMVEKDKNGRFIMIDDPKFDTIFNYLEQKGIPVCGHLGEPKDCWLPLEEMTVNNDKQYYKEHPQYHMYLHPEFPSYEDQIKARDNLLRKHPDLRFMGAHLGSLEWSVDEMASHFDMFPNMAVDMAARMCHIEKQAQDDWQKVHDFFVKYQDRIIYGTDQGDWEGAPEPDSLKAKTHEVWSRDWKFLTTDSVMTSWEVDGSFRGLKLPREIVEKVYYKNAVKWFPGV